jgi:ATP-binding cassette subfamily B multidrug efflux pump
MRQNWAFFQNDFAGRIANRVMQTAQALRESVMSSIRAVWYITVYGVTAFALMARSDWRLGLPTLLWFLGYVVFLRHFVPRMRDLSKASSEVRSIVVARIVDSYTNILTVKLFARPSDEDAYVREVIDEHQAAIAAHMRLISYFMFWLAAMNAVLLTATAAVGIWLWAQGTVGAGVVATALPLAWQIANMAGWVSWEATGISRTSAWCRKACRRWPFHTAASTGRMRRHSKCPAARSASRTSPSTTGDWMRGQCSTASLSRSGPESGSAWWAARVPASRRWST